MAKKTRKSTPKPSGGGMVRELDNYYHYITKQAFRPNIFLAPLPRPLWTQFSPKKSQSSNDLATASETLFPRRYVDGVYAIPGSLMNSDKAKTHDEHTGTVGIDEQGTPQQDEQKGSVPGKTEATPMQCAHGPLTASPALGSFQGRGLSTSSHHVGSAYARVLI